jgi:hypothetical protein
MITVTRKGVTHHIEVEDVVDLLGVVHLLGYPLGLLLCKFKQIGMSYQWMYYVEVVILEINKR